MAEFERDWIRERIRATKQTQKARGEYLGGKPPFGWRVGKAGQLVAVPDQQAIIQRMRALCTNGTSLRTIAATLADEGVQVSHEDVKKILAQIAAAIGGSVVRAALAGNMVAANYWLSTHGGLEDAPPVVVGGEAKVIVFLPDTGRDKQPDPDQA